MNRADLKVGEKFPIICDLEYIVKYERFEDGLWKLLTAHICAFLNTRGGKLVIGVLSDFSIIGVELDNKDVDHTALRFDNHINGISPQVDAKCVSILFSRILDQKFIIEMTVQPGAHRLYYTSFLFRQTFTMSTSGPRVLNREEIRQRNLNQREFCLQLEEFASKTNIFADNFEKMRMFMNRNVGKTLIIHVVGNSGTGKRTLLQAAKEQLLVGAQIITVDFERLLQVEDAYISIIRQLQDVNKLTDHQIDQLTSEHKTMCSIRDVEEEGVDIIFPSSLMRQPNIKLFRLFNIINESIYECNKIGRTVVLELINGNKYITEMIPLHHCVVFITSANDIFIQPAPKTAVLQLKSKALTIEQLRVYFKLQGYLIENDKIIEKMIQITSGSFPKILKIVYEHKNDLELFLVQFDQISVRKQKAFFNDGDQDVPYELIRYMAALSMFPEIFTREMMEIVITKMDANLITPTNIQLVILRLTPYIHNAQGKFFITPQMKSYCMSQVDSSFGIQICKYMIDAMLEELKQVNQQYYRMNKLKIDVQNAESKQDTAYLMQISAMQVNEWLTDFISSVDACIALSIKTSYLTVDLLKEIEPFIGGKISVEKLRELRRTVRLDKQSESSSALPNVLKQE